MEPLDGRVIVATFASNIARVQQVLDAAASFDRKVDGHRPVDGAELPDRDRPRLPEVRRRRRSWPRTSINEVPADKLCIATTGAQGEPMAGLARMANRDHRFVEIAARRHGHRQRQPDPRQRGVRQPDDRQPVQGRRQRLLPHDQARPRLGPRQPGRAQADARPDQAQALHPDPRRVPDAGPARPPGDRDRRRCPRTSSSSRTASRSRSCRTASARRGTPVIGRATCSSTACRWARSATSSCATGEPSPTTACS